MPPLHCAFNLHNFGSRLLPWTLKDTLGKYLVNIAASIQRVRTYQDDERATTLKTPFNRRSWYRKKTCKENKLSSKPFNTIDQKDISKSNVDFKCEMWECSSKKRNMLNKHMNTKRRKNI